METFVVIWFFAIWGGVLIVFLVLALGEIRRDDGGLRRPGGATSSRPPCRCSNYRKILEKARFSEIGITADLQMQIAEEFILHIERVGVSQSEFARLAGLKPLQLSRYLRGDENMKLSTIAKLCSAAKVLPHFTVRQPQSGKV